MAATDIVDRLFARASNSERRAAAQHMKRARDGYASDRRQLRKFENLLSTRIESEWGSAFRDLEILLLETNGIGARFHSVHSERLAKGPRPNLAAALISIHARTGITTAEILYLARGGFPQAALARLRTLSELSAFSSFIARHGEETAERFCAYATIEILRNEKARRAGYGFNSPTEDLTELEARRAALVAKYGTAFGKDYGWAAHALGVSDVRLTTILKSMSATDNASPTISGGKPLDSLERRQCAREYANRWRWPPIYHRPERRPTRDAVAWERPRNTLQYGTSDPTRRQGQGTKRESACSF